MAKLPKTEPDQPMLDYVIEQLEVWKGRWIEVAEGSGIPKRSIEKIASGEWANPGVNSIQTLHDWLRANEKAVA